MNLSEALAALKDKEGYIYILTLPEVPEIIKIVGSKAPKSEVEAEFLPFVIASSHKVDFYEKSTKWLYANMSESCCSVSDGYFKTSVKDAQYHILIDLSRGIGNVSPKLEVGLEMLAELNAQRYQDILNRVNTILENTLKNKL